MNNEANYKNYIKIEVTNEGTIEFLTPIPKKFLID